MMRPEPVLVPPILGVLTACAVLAACTASPNVEQTPAAALPPTPTAPTAGVSGSSTPADLPGRLTQSDVLPDGQLCSIRSTETTEQCYSLWREGNLVRFDRLDGVPVGSVTVLPGN